jgi:hypothetical protein
MNELTKFLVKGILNETPEKVVALFGGGFKPPTKGHLDVVNQGIKQNPEVTEVKILVGGKERNGFTQDQAVKIWNLYNDLNFIGKPATIIPVSSPFSYYKNYLKDNPDDKVYIFIGSREGDEDDKFDVRQRSEFVKKYSDNAIPVEVATTGGVSGTLARKLFKTDIDGFRNMFPENLLDQDFDKILDILNNKSTDNTRKSTPKSTEPLTPLNEGDPKKGTGKKPKGSGRRLYTDEDPSDTVGVKFSTRQDIVDTLNKKSFKAKSHARQSQIINLIHQRVRAALSRTKDPAKKKKLKSGFEYIKGKKEASKKKTERLKKQKSKNENIDPKVQKKHKGKSAPFGSAYEPVKEINPNRGVQGSRYRAIEKRDNKYYYIQDNPFSPGVRQEFGPYKTKAAAKRKMGTFPPAQNYRDITEFIDKIIDEKLCKRGYNYIAKRKREGEKHNPFLTARAVKVCKGQISGSDGKKKKDFRPKKGKKRSAQGRKPDIVKEIGIDLTNYDGQILPGDVLRAPKGFPLGGKKLESSKQLKVIKNSREGVNRYKLSLEDKDGKKYSVRNFEMDGEYKGKKLPKWGLVRKSKKNINEIDYDSIFRTEAYLKTKLTDRDQGDILSDIRSLPGVTIVGSKEVPNRPSREESILSIKVDPYPFTKMDDVSAPEAVDYISSEIRKINGVERFQILKKRVSEGDTYEKMAAKGKKAGSLKQGTVRKRLKIPKDKKIPLSLINKELSRLKKMDKDKDKKGVQLGDKNQKYYKALQLSKTLKTTTNINENATYSSKIDYKQQIKDLIKHMIKKGMNILPLPRVIFKHGDQENASQFLGKTAYYSPSDMTIVLYTEGRHPKDITRSFAHEMIHHIQHLEGRLHDINTTNTNDDDHLNDIEREAYTRGNMVFRNWTDNMDGEEVSSLNEKKKDPFGLNQYARELMKEFQIEDIKPATKSVEEPKEVRIFNPNCGCDKT